MLLVIIVLAIIPLAGIPQSWLLYLFLFFIYLSMANMWNLLAGYSGLLSLCQPAFIGLSGYALVVITWSGLPFYLGIIAGAVVSAIVAVIIYVPVFRLRGIYFAIGTLVIPEILRIIFFRWRPVGEDLSGGGAGYIIKEIGGLSITHFYWFGLVVAVLSVIIIRLILRSSLGLGLAAIRDNDKTASSVGVNVFRLKLYSFIIGAIITGIAGAIFYVYQGYIEPVSAFNIRWTMTMMLAVVIGGISTERGPIIGTIVFVVLYFLLSKYGGISLLIQGIVLIVIMLLMPQGVMGMISRLRDKSS